MFDITIEQSTLMKALEYLEPTVGKNINGLGDNCISMLTTGNGSVQLYTTNTIECTVVEAIVAVGGGSADQCPYIDFKRLKSIVASIPENEMISLKATVNDVMLNFGMQATPMKIVGDNNGMIPLPLNTFGSMVTLPKYWVKDALNNACAIIENSSASPIYNCIRFYTNGLSVEATALDVNNKRTFVQYGQSTVNNATQEILVEAPKLKKSMRLFEDFNEMEFSMDANMILIEAADPIAHYNMKTRGMISGIKYYCRRLSGNFPAHLAQTLQPQPYEFIEVNREEMLSCFNRVKAIEDQTSANLISFEATGSNVQIALATSLGSIEENVSANNALTTGFKTVFKYPNISDILKTMVSATFEIGVLPQHPTNFVVRSPQDKGTMFTVPSMIGGGSTP